MTTAIDRAGIQHLVQDGAVVCDQWEASPVMYTASVSVPSLCLRCQELTGWRAL